MIRLFIAHNFELGAYILLDKKQLHYLSKVMRLKNADRILVFNNKQGEFLAAIELVGKIGQIKILEQTRPYYQTPNICLAFAPVKNVKTEYIITKATELGVREIIPVTTERTIVDKVNLNKLELNAIEASEQCERVDLPQIKQITGLKQFIASLLDENIILADESGGGAKPETLFKTLDIKQKNVILIGPEGGFSDKERKLISSYSNSSSMTLGPRILRADTAIIAAVSLAVNYIGDI